MPPIARTFVKASFAYFVSAFVLGALMMLDRWLGFSRWLKMVYFSQLHLLMVGWITQLAIVTNPKPDRRLNQETIIEERVSLYCGRSHPLWGRDGLSPQELSGLQYISLSSKSPTGQLIREYMATLGIDNEPVVSTDNVETVKKMAEFGLGVAFLPDMVTGEGAPTDKPANKDLWKISIGPPLRRRISIVTWKNSQLSRATKAFIDELKLHAKEWNGEPVVDDAKSA